MVHGVPVSRVVSGGTGGTCVEGGTGGIEVVLWVVPLYTRHIEKYYMHLKPKVAVSILVYLYIYI